jgi:SRSO17 transposase
MPDGKLTDRDRLHVAAFSAFYNASPELPPCGRLMQAIVKSSDEALKNIVACPLLLLAWQLSEKRGVSGAKHGDVGRNPLVEAESAARVRRYRRQAVRYAAYSERFKQLPKSYRQRSPEEAKELREGAEMLVARSIRYMPHTRSITEQHREAVGVV